MIAEGERLVHIMDCNVCHTPKKFTPKGPQPDISRLLSGHPADEKLPPIPEGVISVTGWGGLFNHNLTSWVGPWGISFGSNLTPDIESGIGGWTEDIFIESMRTGTYMEAARPFLPPMPTYDRLTDEELRAMFAYLRSIKPVGNEVPEAKLAPKPTQQK
jgi:mono/diheme cytochrome c family protein